MARILTLIIISCMSSVSWGTKVENGTTSSKLAAKERIRRLIPYMTFYLAQPVSQSLGQPYGQQLPQENDQGWPYPSAQHQQEQQQPQQQQYIVAPHNYQPSYDTRYEDQGSPLARIITQDYLAIAKQHGKLHPRLNLYPQQGPQSYSLANLGSVEPDHLQQEIDKEPQQYTPQYDVGQYRQRPRYRPQTVQTPQNEYKYQDVDYQYRPEVVLQYQTPAPIRTVQQYDNRYNQEQPPAYKPRQKLPSVKQHLTEISRPAIRPNLYAPQNVELRPYSRKPTPFTYQTASTTIDMTEPTVSIMQSQEIEVGTESTRFQTPIVTVTPKYKPMYSSSAPKYHAVYVAKTTTTPAPEPVTFGEHYEYEEDSSNVNNILEGVTKTIPERITAENLDSSIKALSKILKILQRANALTDSGKEVARLPKPIQSISESIYPTKLRKIPKKKPHGDDEDGATPGRAGIDYPVHDEIPQTTFSCKTQRYKGFFGDPETGCQVWHYCDLNGGQASFLCPNGTIFSQVALTCDWWFNVKCASTAQLYVLNERLYKYILPQKPSFPEDYAGPVVDQYLTNKFKEIEQGNKNKTMDLKK